MFFLKKSTKLFFSFSLLFSWFIIECFVVKRENRMPSTNVLKEECCQELGAIVDLGAKIIRELARMQQTSLASVQNFIQGNKENVIGKASRKDLATLHTQVCACRQQLESMFNQLGAYDSLLQDLEKNKMSEKTSQVASHEIK